MQETRQNMIEDPTSGAFSKFVAAQKAGTPSLAQLVRGLDESTPFTAFRY